MPKPGVTTKPAPAKKTPATREERVVIYPNLLVNGIPIPEEKTVIDIELAKRIMGWETQEQYETRKVAENPKVKAKDKKFADAPHLPPVFKDYEGNIVRCWYNARNRPSRSSHWLALAQEILNKGWEFNGEAIIIGKTGIVLSGQHRLIALILANQMWAGRDKAHWQEVWSEPPKIRSIVVFGISEEAKVLKTFDNVMPRTASDVFYTSEMFANKTHGERLTLSKMLEVATTFLWKRTKAGTGSDAWHKFQTHSESIGFVERHGGASGKLLKAIRHVFEENTGSKKDGDDEGGPEGGNALSTMKLSPGMCAGMLYLMGASMTDLDGSNYLEERNEKCLDFSLFDQAKQFFTNLANTDELSFNPVREAVANLIDADAGTTGRPSEKAAVLAKAWEKFLAGEDMRASDLALEYNDDKTKITNDPGFGGIDQGAWDEEKAEKERAAIEERKKQAAEKRQAAREAKAEKEKAAAEAAKNGTPKPDGTTPTVGAGKPAAKGEHARKYLKEKIREKRPETKDWILLHVSEQKGSWTVWDDEAAVAAKLMGEKVQQHSSNGLDRYEFPDSKLKDVLTALQSEGHTVGLVGTKGGTEIVDAPVYGQRVNKPTVPAANKPTANGAAKGAAAPPAPKPSAPSPGGKPASPKPSTPAPSTKPTPPKPTPAPVKK